jgi:hypothetical protein
VKPNQPPADRQRLVTVIDDRLNPRRHAFAVTVRFRTTRSFGNVIQKGQAGSPGGYFKWEIPKGRLTCLFRGVVDGTKVGRAVNSGARRLNDGAWHAVTCKRHPLGSRDDDRRANNAPGDGMDPPDREPEAALDRRQVQLRPGPGHVRLPRRRDRLRHDHARVTDQKDA